MWRKRRRPVIFGGSLVSECENPSIAMIFSGSLVLDDKNTSIARNFSGSLVMDDRNPSTARIYDSLLILKDLKTYVFKVIVLLWVRAPTFYSSYAFLCRNH